MELSCCICKNILNNPVQCNSCLTNFCQKHIKNFKGCPNCKKSPINYNFNSGLIKIINLKKKEIENKKIQTDPEMVECNICSYEGTKWNFCYHFVEEHKDKILEIFVRRKNNLKNLRNLKGDEDIKSSLMTINNSFNCLTDISDFNFQKSGSFFKHRNENDLRLNLVKQNTIEIKPHLSYMFSNIHKTKTKLIKSYKKDIFEISKKKIYYCGRKNELINCKCCTPEHICKTGNCLCVDCMRFNIKKFGLKNKQLINKAGRISYYYNGQYHCGFKEKVLVLNAVGEKKQIIQYCKKNYFCKECKILNSLKEKYLKYIY